MIGDVTLHGELTPLWPWLWLGQWLHVGKTAASGWGAIS
nr:CRISPR system precrRNA processing endoribonuclease RAMP protein Cas6 [Pectobacterium colocasium]